MKKDIDISKIINKKAHCAPFYLGKIYENL